MQLNAKLGRDRYENLYSPRSRAVSAIATGAVSANADTFAVHGYQVASSG
jgi:hypothetical protein